MSDSIASMHQNTNNPSKIRVLSDLEIQQMAAGEVVERPSSVVKELVENALDAGASKVVVHVDQGGKALVSVQDNGHGIHKGELGLSLVHHATSKLPKKDLFAIHSFGFRGEALASIASIADVTIQSRTANDADYGYEIRSEFGKKHDIKQCSCPKGTLITVRNLFLNVPARMQFLKSDRSEVLAIKKLLQKIALQHLGVTIQLFVDNKLVLDFDKVDMGEISHEASNNQSHEMLADCMKQRLVQVFPSHDPENYIFFDESFDGYRMKGLLGLPTFHHASQNYIHIFVNDRVLQDRQLVQMVKTAYYDTLVPTRQPAAWVQIEAPVDEIDVNAHPQKHEIRFLQLDLVKKKIIAILRRALAQNQGLKTSSHILQSFTKRQSQNHGTSSFTQPQTVGDRATSMPGSYASQNHVPSHAKPSIKQTHQQAQDHIYAPIKEEHFDGPSEIPSSSDGHDAIAYLHETPSPQNEAASAAVILEQQQDLMPDNPLGTAKAHVLDNYIVAETSDGIILVDSHAAHERIRYEKLKCDYHEKGFDRQILMVPDIIHTDDDLEKKDILSYGAQFEKYGFIIDDFGPSAVIIREIPSLLSKSSPQKLVLDILEILRKGGDENSPNKHLDAVLSRMACHYSVRSGRHLNQAEMQALLSQMQETDHASQCNHGRPTFIKISKKDIEHMFGRA